jgi:hypothetical protein
VPHGDWDQLSGAQKDALRALFRKPGGIGKVSHVGGRVRLATWRSLERQGLVQRRPPPDTRDMGLLDWSHDIAITRSGMEHIGIDPEAR